MNPIIIQIDPANSVELTPNPDRAIENKTAFMKVVRIEGGALYCENRFYKAVIPVDNPDDFTVGMDLKLKWE